MRPIPYRLLPNTVVLQKRVEVPNGTGEIVPTYPDDGDPIRCSVQDGSHQVLGAPDIDGPVVVDAVVFMRYEDGADVAHLDRLLQTDVTPNLLYRVIKEDDAAGLHHHWEFKCERLLVLAEAGS